MRRSNKFYGRLSTQFYEHTAPCRICGLVETFVSGYSNPDCHECSNCYKNKPLPTKTKIEINLTFGTVETVNYKYYFKNNGNVSLNRIKMIKSRKLCPDGKEGEVVMMDRGKITDRLAYNY